MIQTIFSTDDYTIKVFYFKSNFLFWTKTVLMVCLRACFVTALHSLGSVSFFINYKCGQMFLMQNDVTFQ